MHYDSNGNITRLNRKRLRFETGGVRMLQKGIINLMLVGKQVERAPREGFKEVILPMMVNSIRIGQIERVMEMLNRIKK